MKTTEQRIVELEARVEKLEKAAEQATADKNQILKVMQQAMPKHFEIGEGSFPHDIFNAVIAGLESWKRNFNN